MRVWTFLSFECVCGPHSRTVYVRLMAILFHHKLLTFFYSSLMLFLAVLATDLAEYS